MASGREARILLQRVTFVRELIAELEIDSVEWPFDAAIRLTFENMKRQADEATLTLSLLQPMRKH